QGLPDSEDDDVSARDRNLAYIAGIAAAVDLPVSADFMSGYGLKPEDVAESVTRCVATGVAGLSIEDSTGNPSSPLYELPLAVERVRAARRAILVTSRSRFEKCTGTNNSGRAPMYCACGNGIPGGVTPTTW